VFDPFEATEPGAPRIHHHVENNISYHAFYQWGEPVGDVLDLVSAKGKGYPKKVSHNFI